MNCWSCHGNVEEGALFCSTCNAVQPPQGNNPFALFDIPETFDVDKKEIEAKYLTLQKQLHPDNFVTKSQKEQMVALNVGAALNTAYDTLMNSIKLSCQILENKNISDILNRAPSSELMQQQFELREAVEETNDLENLKQQVASEVEICYKNLSEAFKNEFYEKAVDLTIELQFLTKFEKDVKRKLRAKK